MKLCAAKSGSATRLHFLSENAGVAQLSAMLPKPVRGSSQTALMVRLRA